MQYNYEKICPHCGARIDKQAQFCPKCGAKQSNEQTYTQDSNTYNNLGQTINNTNNQSAQQDDGVSTKWLITLLLCFFLGSLGVHRFYNHRIGTGILMLITCGLCGIWTIIDLIMIILGQFKDKDGNYIKIK